MQQDTTDAAGRVRSRASMASGGAFGRRSSTSSIFDQERCYQQLRGCRLTSGLEKTW